METIELMLGVLWLSAARMLRLALIAVAAVVVVSVILSLLTV